MASIARIPFSTTDEQVITTLNGWMFFLAITHFLAGASVFVCGCFGMAGATMTFAAGPAGATLTVVQMLLLVGLGAVLTAEGVMLVQARAALGRVVATDVADQQFLSTAFHRLKVFFLLEVVWFGVVVLFAILGLAVAVVAPEIISPGLGGLGVGSSLGAGGGL